MTTENQTPEGEQVEGAAPVEGAVETPNTETPAAPQYTAKELQAMEQGWIPKDKYEGDPEDFRSAREFLERGEMIGKIRALTKNSTQLNEAIRHISAQNQKLYDNGYKQAIADLKVEKRAALADNDLVKADEIQEKIEEVKERQAQAARDIPKTSTVDPEHEAWVVENQWYDSDPVLRNFADSLAIEYVRVNKGQVTSRDVRSYVTKTVKEEFSRKFGKPVVAAPSPDGQGRSTNRATGNNGTNQYQAVEAQMTEEDRQIMKTIIKSTGMTKQEYFKQYTGA